MKLRLGALICLLAVTLTACGTGKSPAVPSETAVQPATEPTEAPYTLSDLILVDTETCAFTVTGVEYDPHLGLELRVLCENRSDRPLMFSWNNTSVCGFMYEPFWAVEVPGGKQVPSTVNMDAYALEQIGIDAVDEVTFTLNVRDSEAFLDAPAVEQSFTVYPTGKYPGQIVCPQYRHKEGEAVIADNDALTFIIENVDESIGDFYTLNCYMANRTDKNLMVTWDDVSVNGFTLDPCWAAVLSAGKQTYTQIIFYRADLEERDIEVVQNVEFNLLVSDYEDWEADYLLDEVYAFQPVQ